MWECATAFCLSATWSPLFLSTILFSRKAALPASVIRTTALARQPAYPHRFPKNRAAYGAGIN